MTAFWDWALEAYARPGVAEACLELQDAHGQSVPFLLWAAWTASQGRAPDDDLLIEGAALARRWDALAVGPLRQARRALKAAAPGIDDDARQALRAQVKAVELKSEQVLMQALEALGVEDAGLATPGPTLVRAAAAWGAPAPASALLDLAAKLA